MFPNISCESGLRGLEPEQGSQRVLFEAVLHLTCPCIIVMVGRIQCENGVVNSNRLQHRSELFKHYCRIPLLGYLAEDEVALNRRTGSVS